MKKSLIILLAFLITLTFVSCKNASENYKPLYIQINGDIELFSKEVNLYDVKQTEFTYYTDGVEKASKGYRISQLLEKISLMNADSNLLFTATDGISARIDIATADLCFVVVEEGQINIKAPDHSPVAGIKDLQQITVISNAPVTNGLKIITDTKTEMLSMGELRLLFFEQASQNNKNGNAAYKHTPKKEDVLLSSITDTDNSYLYGEKFDVLKADSDGKLLWNNGKIDYQKNNIIFPAITGIVSGASKIVYDAFDIMKNELSNGNRVMFILPDGLSYEQVEFYSGELTLFSQNYQKATTVHPAISNVALASIITGVSPYNTEITQRGVKKPAKDDIFDYALGLGKTVTYIEGNGNLVLTNIHPIYNIPDSEGCTDVNVFNSAMRALEDNPDLLFVHFHGIDDVNHEYSPISEQAKSKIIETEKYIKQLIEKFDGTVIIVPDHGAITYIDSEGNKKGKHGFFEKEDMFIPFYVLK